MSKSPARSPYATRSEPASDVGSQFQRTRTGYLHNGREPVGLSDRAIGFLIGAFVVLAVGLGVAAILLTAGGQ